MAAAVVACLVSASLSPATSFAADQPLRLEPGVENLLVVPGAVHIPWRDDYEPVPNDVCDRRAREAVGKLVGTAEKLGVYLNIENIFASGYLFSPQEMVDFVNSFDSDRVQIHFDTGNIMEYQFPEHWIPILGKRIKNVHLKEFTKKGTDLPLSTALALLSTARTHAREILRNRLRVISPWGRRSKRTRRSKANLTSAAGYTSRGRRRRGS